MKAPLRARSAAAAALLAGALVVAAGPRVTVGPPPPPPVVPAAPGELTAWLAAREAAVPGLRPGLQKRIQWDGAEGARTARVVVSLHGFTASPLELSPVVEELARALHANAFFMRLSGHGQDGEAMAEVTAARWLADAEEAVAIGRRLGDQVILVGMSTGGTLATWLASRQPAPEALVLLSPNFALKDRSARALRLPWALQLARLVIGPYYSYPPRTPLQAQRWTPRSRVEGLVQLGALLSLVDELDLRRVQVPTLVVYAPDDAIVDVGRIQERFAELASPRKRLVPLDGARHVLAGDALAPENNERLRSLLLEFLR